MGPQSVALSVAGVGGSTGGTRAASPGPDKAAVDPRIQAVVRAARFYGAELDPVEFSCALGETVPSAASLAAWAQESGLWSRAVRLRWRHLMRLQSTGPVVL